MLYCCQKASDEIKVFKEEQAAKKAAEPLFKKEYDEGGTFRRNSGEDDAAVEDFPQAAGYKNTTAYCDAYAE